VPKSRTGKPLLRSQRVTLMQVDGVVCMECGALLINPEQHAAFHIRLVGREVRVAKVHQPMGELEQVVCHDCGTAVWRHAMAAHNRMHHQHDPREFGQDRE
jgi:ribosomal protein S27E